MNRSGAKGATVLDIPAPHLSPGGSSSLVRVLSSLLPGIDYDTLMGISGIAFALRVSEQLDPRAAEDLLLDNLPEKLALLGAGVQVVRATDPSQVLQRVRDSVSAGSPVPVRGWPEPGLEWSLVVGYDDLRGVLCGWPARWTEDHCAGAPAAGDVALIVTRQAAPPDLLDSWRNAVLAAVADEPALKAAYARWRQELLGPAPASDADGWRLAHNHALLVESVADARTSAAAFGRACAAFDSSATAEWLERAAYCYEDLADALDGAPGLDREAAESGLDPSVKQAWAGTIPRVERLDLEALGLLRMALSSPLAPSEIDEEPDPSPNWT